MCDLLLKGSELSRIQKASSNLMCDHSNTLSNYITSFADVNGFGAPR